MRKIILAMLFSATIIIAGCNLDAAEGIYSEAAASTESTSVTVRSYLGNLADGANTKHIYLADDGIYYITVNAALATVDNGIIMKSTSDNLIQNAYMDTAGNLLVFSKDKSTLSYTIKYYTAGNYSSANKTTLDMPADPSSGDVPHGLTGNGLAYTASKVYSVSAGTATEVFSGSVSYVMSTGDYAFFSVLLADKTHSYYVVDKDGNIKIDNISSALEKNDSNFNSYIGFQPLDDAGTTFMLLSYDKSGKISKAYRISTGDTEITESPWFSMKSSVSHAGVPQIASFMYKKDSDIIALKGTNYFDICTLSGSPTAPGTTVEVSTTGSGFAKNLRTAEITNIVKLSENVFIAGTTSSMLYLIDIASDTSTQIR